MRATKRGEEPIKPQDPYLIRDVATLLIDCRMRPEETASDGMKFVTALCTSRTARLQMRGAYFRYHHAQRELWR